MGSGLDTPTPAYAAAQDPILAGLHEKLLNSAQADPLRLSSSPTDFTPGAPGTDNGPGVRVADASSPPNLLDASSPPAPKLDLRQHQLRRPKLPLPQQLHPPHRPI
jgi:hypothetical protein